MTTDPTALQESIARRFYEAAGFARPWEKATGPAHDRYMARARMVLPFIAAEVRAASERAWGEGVAAWRDYESGLDPRLGHPRRDTPLNPYRATEYETGGRA